MQISEIKIQLIPANPGRLRAFCSLTFDGMFVVRDVKLIEGDTGLFLAMPSRKVCDHCPRCREKNHIRARFCNHCGQRLPESRQRADHSRPKLHCDIAHPITAQAREDIERQVLEAYHQELMRSREPGYIPSAIDTDVPELIHNNIRPLLAAEVNRESKT